MNTKQNTLTTTTAHELLNSLCAGNFRGKLNRDTLTQAVRLTGRKVRVDYNRFTRRVTCVEESHAEA